MLNKDDFNTILLYSATRDGDTIEKCCEKCEGKGPTIHVFKLTNGFRFGIYAHKNLLKNSEIKDPSIFAFSLTNKRKYEPKNKENVNLNHLFKDYLFCMICDGCWIYPVNNCLSSNKMWINYKSLSNCNTQELCGLYKDEWTTFLEYEVFHIKY